MKALEWNISMSLARPSLVMSDGRRGKGGAKEQPLRDEEGKTMEEVDRRKKEGGKAQTREAGEGVCGRCEGSRDESSLSSVRVQSDITSVFIEKGGRKREATLRQVI